jgi:ribosome-associated protein
MLTITDNLVIPISEFRFEFARSAGPGGQNVNKVASKATLCWRPAESPSLPHDVRERLLAAVRTRLTIEGELRITSQRTRDQQRNIADCLDKLRQLVAAAARPPRPRRKTRPTLASRIRRAEDKSRRSERKQRRRPVDTE